jgi:hypothetical protein
MYRWATAEHGYLYVKDVAAVLLRHGLPQGGELQPTLFILYMNDMVSTLPKGIHTVLYVDDLVLWCTEEYAIIVTYRMHQLSPKLDHRMEKQLVCHH